MSWLVFGQIVLLIAVFAFANSAVKCLHATYCTRCRKQP